MWEDPLRAGVAKRDPGADDSFGVVPADECDDDITLLVLDGLRWAYPYRLAQTRAQPGDTVTITITGPVSNTWHLVAAATGWVFRDQPGPRLAASLMMNTEQAWQLLTNNLPAAAKVDPTAVGDETITSILLHTRAIIGTPKWA